MAEGVAAIRAALEGADQVPTRRRSRRAELPAISVSPGNLSVIATEAEKALLAAQVGIYRRGTSLVRPITEEVEAFKGRKTHVAQLLRLDAPYLRDVLGRVAHWTRFSAREKKKVPCDPPAEVAATILARSGEWLFPAVVGVITTPTLREDGTILEAEGYDAATRLLLVSPPQLNGLSRDPTKETAVRSLDLLNALLRDFPFEDDASRSVALSALITPVVRGAFSVAPMHVARAPTPGSGKSFLMDVVAAIGMGQRCPVMAAGRSEEETEKRLGAALLAGQPLIVIDNVADTLGGDFLCQAIERPIVEVRILGRSERVRIENRGVTLFATGNNVVLLGDMTRRALVCTLDPKVERPELRRFTHDPVGEVLADRGRYIAACINLVSAYLTAGQPNRAPPLASFEGWSNTVRSSLIWLGCADPVDTMDQSRAEDPVLSALRAILEAFEKTFGVGYPCRRTVANIIRAAEERLPAGDDYDAGAVTAAHPD